MIPTMNAAPAITAASPLGGHVVARRQLVQCGLLIGQPAALEDVAAARIETPQRLTEAIARRRRPLRVRNDVSRIRTVGDEVLRRRRPGFVLIVRFAIER